jgi:SAM-dependent methyltransferase
MKRYDRDYFDHWYRGERVRPRAELERRVRLALAAAEYALGRPVRTALDVGCGEGEWGRVLRALRPKLRYTGVDPSEYAVERFGARRNLVLGDLASLGELGLPGPFDLVVCADVLHYVSDRELARGASLLAELTGGVAWLETFTSADRVEGDRRGFLRRPAAFYGRAFRRAGFTRLGLHCWAGPPLARAFAALERAEQART